MATINSINANQLLSTTANPNFASVNGLKISRGLGANPTSVAVGLDALSNTSGGVSNTALGWQALLQATSGGSNTAVGGNALQYNSTGSRNIALGYDAGAYETGSDAFYVDNQDRTNTAGDKAGAILYGQMHATPASQVLTVNAALKVAQTIDLGHATDTTLSRVSAGVVAVEGVVIPSVSSTNTLTNKRVTKRLTTTNAPGATPSTNTDNVDIMEFTGLNTAITSMTTNLSGTPIHGDFLEFMFLDDGTARAVTWGTSFASGGLVNLPTTTVISTVLRVLLQYQTTASLNKWVCVAVA